LESKSSSLSTDFCKSESSRGYSSTECDFFRSDSPAELALIREEALSAGADAAVVSSHWAEGGAGARALAEAVIEICEGTSQFKFLYDLELSIEEKITIIGKEIYGADGIELSDLARQQVETYTRQGYSNLPSKSSSIVSID
jgi:methylenetetrahydrofolate dehydrogenase (NADP+)/methenyltetrahydrofolate cyclohydrolase/formyltetrahydrofolate synthetase